MTKMSDKEFEDLQHKELCKDLLKIERADKRKSRIKKIPENISLEDDILHGSLKNIQKNISYLIEEYGEEAEMCLDAGYVYISILRDETSKEKKERLRLEKQKKIETQKIVEKKMEEKETQELLALIKQNKKFVKELLGKKGNK
jgi:hypothetical protein